MAPFWLWWYHLGTTKLSSIDNKIEAVQYNAALVITRAIQATSKIKVSQELGLESVKSCR